MILEYFRNRKSVGWFFGAGLLLLVIVAFVALYFPDFMGDPATAAMRREVAWVDDEAISASEFLDRYRQAARSWQEQSGGQFSPALARQVGLPDQVAAELVRDRLLVLEAKRFGIRVSDSEVGEWITTAPSFQQNGAFVGREAYLGMLRAARLDPRDFEESLRQDLLSQKLQRLVTQSLHVSDLELVEEYRRRNENAALEVWFVASAGHRGAAEVTDDDARRRYEADPEAFELPARRRVRYLTLSASSVAEEITVNRREIQRHYNRNLFQYQQGEQAEASHILLTPESEAAEAETEELAAELRDRARGGEDFAELARAYSADEATAADGGSLGVFGPEEMVPEFSDAVFSMSPGEISDPVRTDYGFHIVRLETRQAAETQELAEVEEDIRALLRQQKSAERLDELVIELEQRAPGAGSLEDLGRGYPSLLPQESEFFSAEESVPALGSAEVAARAFELEVGEVGGPVRLANGFAFFEVVERRPPEVPEFEETKERLLEQLRDEAAMDAAAAAASGIAASVAAGERTAEDPATFESWFRGSPLGAAGLLERAEERIFAASVGEVVGPIAVADGFAVVRVNGLAGFAESVFEEQKETFRAQLAEEKKGRLWAAFLGAAQDRHSVRIDRRAIHDLIG